MVESGFAVRCTAWLYVPLAGAGWCGVSSGLPSCVSRPILFFYVATYRACPALCMSVCVCVCMKAMKRGLDCASLDCLQSEPASEVMRVQESIMGVPRSVGDFFT